MQEVISDNNILLCIANDATIITKHTNWKSLEINTFTKINNPAQLLLNADITNVMCLQTHKKQNSRLSKVPTFLIGEKEVDRPPIANSVDFLGVRLDEEALDWCE